MNEEEIENFIYSRNYSIKSTSYTWETSKDTIIKMINQLFPSDSKKIRTLNTTVEAFDEIINEIKLELENESIPSSNNLLSHEKHLFSDILNSLKNWHVDFLSLLLTDNEDYDEDEKPSILENKYKEINYELRYQHDPNYKFAKTERRIEDWKYVNHFPIIFSYVSIFTEVRRMRDQIIHNTGARANRKEMPIKKDHILNNKMPGNSISLCSTITLCIYGYIELLETLYQSMEIGRTGGLESKPIAPNTS